MSPPAHLTRNEMRGTYKNECGSPGNRATRLGGITLNTRATETPTPKRKNGMTKSASVTPVHGAWLMDGNAPPASSTRIINWRHRNARNGEKTRARVLQMQLAPGREKEICREQWKAPYRHGEAAEDIERR